MGNEIIMFYENISIHTEAFINQFSPKKDNDTHLPSFFSSQDNIVIICIMVNLNSKLGKNVVKCLRRNNP